MRTVWSFALRSAMTNPTVHVVERGLSCVVSEALPNPWTESGSEGSRARLESETRTSRATRRREMQSSDEGSSEPPPAGEWRNWAELPRDVLWVIFRKLGAFEVLFPAQWVCRAWKQFSHEPALWRCVDMRFHSDMYSVAPMEEIAMRAVDRSAGQLEEFFGEYCGSDELLRYIADSTTRLRNLRLICCYDITDKGLIELANKFPCLEELEITLCAFSDGVCEPVGRACSQLKHFRWNMEWSRSPLDLEVADVGLDTQAFAIANTMHELRQLQMVGGQVTNTGLVAILDNCPHLESLDIRCCFNVRVDGDLRRRLSRVREVKLPNDSTHDYEFLAIADGFFDEDDDDDDMSLVSEVDFLYDDMFDDDDDMFNEVDDYGYNEMMDDEYDDFFL